MNTGPATAGHGQVGGHHLFILGWTFGSRRAGLGGDPGGDPSFVGLAGSPKVPMLLKISPPCGWLPPPLPPCPWMIWSGVSRPLFTPLPPLPGLGGFPPGCASSTGTYAAARNEVL